MAAIWGNAERFNTWLKVEIAVCEALSRHGKIPKDALAAIKKKAAYNEGRIAEIEGEVHHDVIAFLTSVAEVVGPESRYIHLGMTSSDLTDTAFAIQLKKAGAIIVDDILKLMEAVKKRAFEHRLTAMIGRTHGIHAEPVTFGLKLASWYAELERHAKRLEDAISNVAVGKISGAVGTYTHIAPEIECDVLKKLGLEMDTVSTQIISRDRHAHFFSVLAGIAATIEKIAVEIRHLQRTEVGEVAEPFGRGQKGSSAMPHKRNPILCENISGLARIVRANSTAALENVVLWHERDISHSSVERVIAPDSTILVNFMLARLTKIIDGLEVFPERMKANIEMTRGLYASQDVMLALVHSGMTREVAYKLVQGIAMRSWKEEKPFYGLLTAEKKVTSRIGPSELGKILDPKIHLKYVDAIFKRVFREKK